MEHAAYDRHGKLIEDAIGNKLKRILTSTLILISAFIVSDIIFQLITWSIAKIIGYHVGVNYNGINATHNYRDWSRLRIMAVELPGPVLCLLLSIFIYRYLSRETKWITTQRLFFFWLMICLANQFFGQLSTAPVELTSYTTSYYNHFACIAVWWDFNTALMTILAVISIAATVLYGAIIGREILRYSFSKGLITTQWGKSSVVFQFFVLPLAIAFIPLVLLASEISLVKLCLSIASLFLIALGILIRGAVDSNIVRCNKQDVLNHVPVTEFAIAAALWLVIFVFFRT